MIRLASYWAASLLTLVMPLLPISVSAQQPSVSLSVSHGSLTSTDWLLSPFPLLVAPGQPASSVITIDPKYLDASRRVQMYTGRLNLSVSCCFIPGQPGWVGPGIDVSVSALPSTTLNLGGATPPWVRERLGSSGLTLSSTSVDVPGQPVTVTLTAKPGPLSDLVPGKFLALVAAEDPTQRISTSVSLLIHVLGPWPPDGPAPGCTPPGLAVLPLSQIDPNPYVWKANHLSQTSYAVAAAERGPISQVGLSLRVREVSGLAPTTSIIQFQKTEGRWPAGIRSSNSTNCSASTPVTTVGGGATTTVVINRPDTTTLVFSRSVCRAFFIFCWGQLGMDDVLTLSEGAFWTLFGGRAVDIKTVGNWDKAVNPFDGEATLTIMSP